jgi:hypothetical protein
MNLIELSEKFPTELHCIEYAESIRYGEVVKCCYCKSEYLSKRRPDYRHKCLLCERSTSVTVGTHLHNTRIPLRTWYYAVSVITDAKKGISALQLQRNIDVSYPTAFRMYHKLRGLMADENTQIEELDGIVEMDETYIGGKPRKFNDGTTTPHDYELKLPDMDAQIEELKEVGITFTGGKGNRAKPAIMPKSGRELRKYQ